MKLTLTTYACGLCLLGAVATTRAQTTWNYFISDAGGGNSLLTWSVTGSLATSPGAILLVNESSLTVAINAPGIFADSFAPDAAPQSVPTADGSYFQYSGTSVYAPVTSYLVYNALGSGNDSFGLSARLLPRTGAGYEFLYIPGNQSAVIPIAFSDFNPGAYQSELSGFSTPVTVNLTVSAVPEPSAVALFVAGGLSGGLLLRRRNDLLPF